MKLERKTNAIRNIRIGLLNKVITIICPFVLRTVLIYTLGTQYLGLSSLFTSVLQVLSLSELGIGSAMVFGLYQPIANDDIYKIRELTSLYRYVYRIIGTIILLGGLAVLPFLSYFVKGSCPNDINIYILYLLYLINSSESYFLAAYKSTILSAYQRRDIISEIGLVVHVLLYSIQIVCLLNFKNYYVYVIWIPIFTAVENLATAKYVNTHYSNYIVKSHFLKNDIKNLLIKVRDLFGHKLSQVVTNSVDTIVISSFLGLKLVTIYNNYFYLMSAVAGILDILYQAILAGIGNSLFSENEEKNQNDFKRFTVLNSWIVGWCAICFLCLFQPMMKIWMGKKLLLNGSTIVLLSVYFFVWKARQPILIYKDALGLWNIDKWKPYVEILVNLTVNILMVQTIGVNGIVISTIISMILVSIPWETKCFFKNVFQDAQKQYLIITARYISYTCVAGGITYGICRLIVDTGIGMFILKIIICLIIPNLIILYLGRNNKLHNETIRFAISLTPLKKIFVERDNKYDK